MNEIGIVGKILKWAYFLLSATMFFCLLLLSMPVGIGHLHEQELGVIFYQIIFFVLQGVYVLITFFTPVKNKIKKIWYRVLLFAAFLMYASFVGWFNIATAGFGILLFIPSVCVFSGLLWLGYVIELVRPNQNVSMSEVK